jgi:hypothetical protein
VRRYRSLVWKEWQKKVVDTSANKKDVCRKLIVALFQKLQQLDVEERSAEGVDGTHVGGGFVTLGMQLGKTKVFLRQCEFEGLERQRSLELHKAAIKLNAAFRGFLVRGKWAEYVPLLRKERTDFLRDRERKLWEEQDEQTRMYQSFSDLAATFSGSCDQLIKSEQRQMVASKVGTRNPLNRADAMRRGPKGSFKWVDRNGAWVKKYVGIDESFHSLDDSQSHPR